MLVNNRETLIVNLYEQFMLTHRIYQQKKKNLLFCCILLIISLNTRNQMKEKKNYQISFIFNTTNDQR